MKLLKHSNLRALLLIASMLCSIELYAANPCVLPSTSEGIGGTGHTLGDGIGGTGLRPDSGVGGTGRSVQDGMGGTGQKLAVVGIITGFASVCVNGIEVHYDDNTQVNINGEKAMPAGLMTGQLVSMTAEKTPRGWSASRINTNDAVSGPVTKLVGANRIEVAGQMVNLPNKLAAMPRVNVGQPLRVQGLRAENGEIVATSVTQSTARQTVISGRVDRRANGSLAIGNTQIDGLDVQIKPGEHLSVTGDFANGRLRATQAARALALDSGVQQLSIQSSVFGVKDNVMQLSYGIQINTKLLIKAGDLVSVVAQKDKNGVWQLLDINNQTHEDLMRRVGKRQQLSADEEKQDKSGKNDKEDEAEKQDNSGSGSSGSENSGSGSIGSDSSGSGSGRSIDRSTSGSGSGSGASGADRIKVDKPSSSDRVRIEPPSSGDRVRIERPSGSSGSGRGGRD